MRSSSVAAASISGARVAAERRVWTAAAPAATRPAPSARAFWTTARAELLPPARRRRAAVRRLVLTFAFATAGFLRRTDTFFALRRKRVAAMPAVYRVVLRGQGTSGDGRG